MIQQEFHYRWVWSLFCASASSLRPFLVKMEDIVVPGEGVDLDMVDENMIWLECHHTNLCLWRTSEVEEEEGEGEEDGEWKERGTMVWFVAEWVGRGRDRGKVTMGLGGD